jgi:predicted dehydrogenase
MMKRYRWGILGPGRIAEKFAEGLKLCNNAVLWSVGSRDAARAEAFAQKFGFARSFGSYEEMVADPELDVVYIATPHSHHHEQTLLCLNSGKHVLCEKAFALNLREVEEMVALAKSKNLFLMEALWPPFQPSYIKADEIIRSGELGRVMTIAGRFGFVSPYDPASRVYDLKLGGGSLLDIGIYPVMDILRYMGMPAEISAVASFAPTGADESLLAVLDYGDERQATAYSSFIEDAGIGTTIVFEKGKIILERNREKIQFMTVEREGAEPETYQTKPEASGFQYEAAEVMNCLDEGTRESDVVPHSFSLNLMKLLDNIRSVAGISYPGRDI